MANALPSTSRRAAGVLLHPTCLPSPHGIGDLGEAAYAFVDWLHAAGAKVWQVLPLGPTGGGDSPYASPASLAGNPWLVDLQQLVRSGLLQPSEVMPPPFAAGRIDMAAMIAFKRDRLHRAADRLLGQPHSPQYAQLHAFRTRHPWVLDAALFQALREQRDYRPWWTWEAPLRDRDRTALQAEREALRTEVDRYIVLQHWFDQQWRALRSHAARKGVALIGDVPIYVDADSADTWCHRRLFQLDATGAPLAVAGVPPDYFSELGQLWGNPLYDWKAMARDGYRWWAARLQRALELTDRVRIDHFRGFSAYWAVPAGATDARGGAWHKGPGVALFRALQRHLAAGSADGKQPLPLIAEDLGVIDDEVVALRRSAGLPGMLVLQFAWGGDAANPFLPHNHVRDAVVYSGTHDNDTTLGWWQSSPAVREHVSAYLGKPMLADVSWSFIQLALQSVADLAIVPVQDILGLGSAARMNTPGLAEHNWTWRLQPGQLTVDHARRFAAWVRLYGR
jgi:4-alpha-glucanotransferase